MNFAIRRCSNQGSARRHPGFKHTLYFYEQRIDIHEAKLIWFSHHCDYYWSCRDSGDNSLGHALSVRSIGTSIPLHTVLRALSQQNSPGSVFTKACSSITSASGVQSFWDFAQSTAMILLDNSNIVKEQDFAKYDLRWFSGHIMQSSPGSMRGDVTIRNWICSCFRCED